MSNGDPHRRVSIDIVDDARHYAYFEPGRDEPPLDTLPMWLNRAVIEWLQKHPERTVRATLPIISKGTTVAIHLWYDCHG